MLHSLQIHSRILRLSEIHSHILHSDYVKMCELFALKVKHRMTTIFTLLLFSFSGMMKNVIEHNECSNTTHITNSTGKNCSRNREKPKKVVASSNWIWLNHVGVLYSMVIVYRFLLSFILNLVQSFPMTESPNYINLIDTSNASPITSQLVNWTIFDNKLQI